ncbi:zinc finger protein lin-13 [Ditylenchus destructor]|nr:zinc finger protein lin-13 [Ditylenchus destructor]
MLDESDLEMSDDQDIEDKLCAGIVWAVESNLVPVIPNLIPHLLTHDFEPEDETDEEELDKAPKAEQTEVKNNSETNEPKKAAELENGTNQESSAQTKTMRRRKKPPAEPVRRSTRIPKPILKDKSPDPQVVVTKVVGKRGRKPSKKVHKAEQQYPDKFVREINSKVPRVRCPIKSEFDEYSDDDDDYLTLADSTNFGLNDDKDIEILLESCGSNSLHTSNYSFFEDKYPGRKRSSLNLDEISAVPQKQLRSNTQGQMSNPESFARNVSIKDEVLDDESGEASKQTIKTEPFEINECFLAEKSPLNLDQLDRQQVAHPVSCKNQAQMSREENPQGRILYCFICVQPQNGIVQLGEHLSTHPENWSVCQMCVHQGRWNRPRFTRNGILDFYKHMKTHHVLIRQNTAMCPNCRFESTVGDPFERFNEVFRHMIFECEGVVFCMLCNDFQLNKVTSQGVEQLLRHRWKQHRALMDRFICSACKTGFYARDVFWKHECVPAIRCVCNQSNRFLNEQEYILHSKNFPFTASDNVHHQKIRAYIEPDYSKRRLEINPLYDALLRDKFRSLLDAAQEARVEQEMGKRPKPSQKHPERAAYLRRLRQTRVNLRRKETNERRRDCRDVLDSIVDAVCENELANGEVDILFSSSKGHSRMSTAHENDSIELPRKAPSQISSNPKCTDCNITFSGAFDLLQHKRQEHGFLDKLFEFPVDVACYLCVVCSVAFQQFSDHEMHKQRHKEALQGCRQCSAVATSSADYDKHHQIHINPRLAIYACSSCRVHYHNEFNLMFHLAENHQTILAFFCKQCNLCSTDGQAIITHFVHKKCGNNGSIDFLGMCDAAQVRFQPHNAYNFMKHNGKEKKLKIVMAAKCPHPRAMLAANEPLITCRKCNCPIRKSRWQEMFDDPNDPMSTVEADDETGTQDKHRNYERVLGLSKRYKLSSLDGKSQSSVVTKMDGKKDLSKEPLKTVLGTKLDGVRIPTKRPAEFTSPSIRVIGTKLLQPETSGLNQIRVIGSSRLLPARVEVQRTLLRYNVPNRLKPPPGYQALLPGLYPTNQQHLLPPLPHLQQMPPVSRRPIPPVSLPQRYRIREPIAVVNNLEEKKNSAAAATPSPRSSSQVHIKKVDERLKTKANPNPLNSETMVNIGARSAEKTDRPTTQTSPASSAQALSIEAGPHVTTPRIAAVQVPSCSVNYKTHASANFNQALQNASRQKVVDIAMERRMQEHRQIQGIGPSPGQATLAIRPKILGNPVMIPRNFNGPNFNEKKWLGPNQNMRRAVSVMRVSPAILAPKSAGRSFLELQSAAVRSIHPSSSSNPSHPPEPSGNTWKSTVLDNPQFIQRRILFMRTKPQSKVYLCARCNTTQVSQMDAVMHQVDKHGIKGVRYQLTCPICHLKYDNLMDFYAHITQQPRHMTEKSECQRESQMSGDIKCCGLCGTVRDFWVAQSITTGQFFNHTAFHGFNTAVVCKICDTVHVNDPNHTRHFITRHLTVDFSNGPGNHTYTCKACSEVLNKQDFIEHFKERHMFTIVEYVCPDESDFLTVTASAELEFRFKRTAK